jgi:putative sterol carrier protein
MATLPERFRPKMAGNLVCRVQFDFAGSDRPLWELAIERGECRVTEGQSAQPDATVRMEAADFIGINTGDVPAPDLFWSGKIQILGSVEVVVGLAPIFGWQ